MLKPHLLSLSLIAFFSLFFVSSSLNPTFAYYTNMPASIVVGQPDLVTANTGISSSNLDFPDSVFAADGRMYVADRNNNRVLIWNSIPTTNNQPADVVLGQPDFGTKTANFGGLSASSLNAPSYVFAVNGKLYVADRSNNRILIWNSIPTTNNQPADLVVLKSSFTDTTTTTTRSTGSLGAAAVVTSDGTRLIVVAPADNRVLIWNSIPTTNGAQADVVVGQQSFTIRAANDSTGDGTTDSVTATTLNVPDAAFSDRNKLFIADASNNRVLVWNSLPTVNGQAADIVVGQQSMTVNAANDSNGDGITDTTSANSLGLPRGVFVAANRFFVTDDQNDRLLIYNSIPVSNGASADIVIGQPDMVTNANPTGQAVSMLGAKDLGGLKQVAVYNNQIFITQTSHGVAGRSRVVIFNNVLSSPTLNISEVDNQPGGKLKARGGIRLGERGRYSLQRVQVSVNGEEFSDVTHKSGGRDDGEGQTTYDYYHEFEPWANNGTKQTWAERGYTLVLKASSFNAEDNNIFYFQPFNLTSVTSKTLPQVTFTVNKYQWQKLKDNLDSFEIHAKKEGSNQWTTYSDQLPVNDDDFDETTGIVTLTLRPRPGVLFTSGKYAIKVVAKDKWGHRQDSNALGASLTGISGSAYNPLHLAITNHWFPLQVNRISGVRTGILASFNPASIVGSYTTISNSTTFEGIAFSGATVAVQVTDTATGKAILNTTKVVNSQWKLTPTLYSNSQVDVSVYDDAGRYNELPPLLIKVAQPIQPSVPEQ